MGLPPATRRLRAALSFLQLPPTEPELHLLHRWLDAWGRPRPDRRRDGPPGFRLSLSHIAEGEWRCAWMGDNPMLAPAGDGAATTPWAAVQVAGWAVVSKTVARYPR